MAQFFKKFYSIGLVGVYIILMIAGFYMLYISKTGESLETPWQTIHPYYIYIFFAATLVLGCIILCAPKKFFAYSILLLILHSILFHSYLPLTHELLYGADQWRHIANEIRILNGEPFLKPAIDATGQSFIQQLDIGDIAYRLFWYVSVAVAWLTSLDLITINKWSMPLLWGITFPLLLYWIGKLYEWGRRQTLFYIFISFLPFTWAVGGSITLPNSLGFLWWLVVWAGLLKRLNNPHQKKYLWAVFIGWVSLFFGYSLYLIIFTICWVTAEVVLKARLYPNVKNWLYGGVLTLGMIFIPILELVAHYSYFTFHRPWFAEIKQFIGNVTGTYIAFGPRPHDIDRGNIIFNQPGIFAFVQNAFTVYRLWIMLGMVLFFCVVFIGVWRGVKEKMMQYQALSFSTIIFTGSYFIGRYVLNGEQILSRRLEHTVAFFWITSFVIGLDWLYRNVLKNKVNFESRLQKILVIIGILTCSILITASYSLGPDVHAVSKDQYKSMEAVWLQEKDEFHYCVLADTYPLLVLEAISHKKIIGGNFPINQYFAQPEREKLFKELAKNAQPGVWQEILRLSGTSHCWLVIKKQDLQYNDLVREQQYNIKAFGDILVWKYSK